MKKYFVAINNNTKDCFDYFYIFDGKNEFRFLVDEDLFRKIDKNYSSFREWACTFENFSIKKISEENFNLMINSNTKKMKEFFPEFFI